MISLYVDNGFEYWATTQFAMNKIPNTINFNTDIILKQSKGSEISHFVNTWFFIAKRSHL